MLAYDEILKNCPALREVVEGKITEEVAKKQVEIDALKQENQSLQLQIDDLTLMVGDMMLGGAL